MTEKQTNKVYYYLTFCNWKKLDITSMPTMYNTIVNKEAKTFQGVNIIFPSRKYV